MTSNLTDLESTQAAFWQLKQDLRQALARAERAEEQRDTLLAQAKETLEKDHKGTFSWVFAVHLEKGNMFPKRPHWRWGEVAKGHNRGRLRWAGGELSDPIPLTEEDYNAQDWVVDEVPRHMMHARSWPEDQPFGFVKL